MPHATAAPESSIESVMNYHYEPAPGEDIKIPYVNTAGSKRIKHTPQRVRITDLRTTDNHFTVDENGFQFLKYPGPVGTKHESFSNDAIITDAIFNEARELIKNTTGATHVYAMSHMLRRDPALAVVDIPEDVPDEAEYRSTNVPAMQVHIDHTNRSADTLLECLTIPEAEYVRSKAANCRWAVINLWKPLKTVTRQPLAVCDATTVPESDLRGYTMRVRPEVSPDSTERNVEIWHVMANPEHKWYWPSAMEPNEALLIKCFDSKLDGRARWAPHSAFNLPDDQGAPRESIEIRCLVLWEDQSKE
ncbi:hypothetical protein CERZMDRAFT_37850 [Cercospora zeae-maydis SCOH1-5]|uniref:GA4 desaturase family protein n=1 Tax=Cercospora zeae-maydis SCOH1-5 TaxID=717836 RepID=A0A6A6FLV4_9PEZI|nr:hypothetical protein CERZMDRAFT_37850 [Cercospora zeae-maydis SCOH1-5]